MPAFRNIRTSIQTAPSSPPVILPFRSYSSYSRGTGVPAREKCRASLLARATNFPLFPIPVRSAPNNLPLSKGKTIQTDAHARSDY
jgi:hypothetical protein